jgi:hypothetical protein
VHAPSLPTDDQNKAAVQAALATLESTVMVPQCWTPLVAQKPEPATATYRFDTTFSPTGQEIARGVSELRGRPSRSDVANCLSRLPLSLTIPPPGRLVRFEILVDLP